MKVLICGSRHFNDYDRMKKELDAYSNITEIVHGAARGADTLGGRYGEEAGIPVRAFPADWETHGKRAGPIRNSRMLKEGDPDMVIAFRGPNSRGTQNMIDQSLKAGIPVKIYDILETTNG